MRGVVPGLASPLPLLEQVPGVLQEDPFLGRLLGAFDDGLAPIIATLDGLACYVDPWLAPEDFLQWLAGWVGVDLDDAWSLDQHRSVVAGAAGVHRRRGTYRGVVDALRLAFDADVELTDTGGCSWSPTPGGDVPDAGPPAFEARVFVRDPSAIDLRRVEAVIEFVKPAHVAHTVEVLPLPGTEDGD